MTISYIAPRRHGKSTFAIERYLKDPDNTYVLLPHPAMARYLREVILRKKLDSGKVINKTEVIAILGRHIIAVDDFIYRSRSRGSDRIFITDRTKLVVEEADVVLRILLGSSIDTITGTMMRVPIKEPPHWIDPKELSTWEKEMDPDTYKKEFECIFEGE